MSRFKLRYEAKATIGLALILVTVVALVGGDGVNGLVLDEVSPLVAAALASVFGAVVLIGWASRGMLRRAYYDDPIRVVILDSVQGVRELGWPMGKQIARMAVSNIFVLPLTLLALQRLHSLGTVTAVLFGGPLLVAVYKMATAKPRRLSGLFWPVLASAGVSCLTLWWEGELDVLGLLLACGAAACYANFLLTYDRMSAINADGIEKSVALSSLVSATSLAALTAITLAVLSATDVVVPGVSLPGDHWMSWRVLGITALSGLLVGFVAQVAQNLIFGKELVEMATFSVALSIEPAVGFVIGWLLLSHQPTVLDVLGTVLVFLAGFCCFYQLEVRGKKVKKTAVQIDN